MSTGNPIPGAEKEELTELLAARGERYGTFSENSKIMQDLKDRMRATPNWSALAADQKECLDMIAHKVGRILGGDPNYHDNWIDISGYAKLVADRLHPTKEVMAGRT